MEDVAGMPRFLALVDLSREPAPDIEDELIRSLRGKKLISAPCEAWCTTLHLI
jgi:hypothetical protein